MICALRRQTSYRLVSDDDICASHKLRTVILT